MSATMRALTSAAIAGLTAGAWVDMGSNTACRHSNDPGVAACQDGDPCIKYIQLPDIATLNTCKAICDGRVGCHGIEYKASSNRCEIWMDTIGRAQTGMDKYQCFMDDAAASKTKNTDMWATFNLTLKNTDLSNMTGVQDLAAFSPALVAAFQKLDASSFANLTAHDVLISMIDVMGDDTHVPVNFLPADSYNPLLVYQMLVGNGHSHLKDVVPEITAGILPLLTDSSSPLADYTTGTPAVQVVGQALSMTGPARPPTPAPTPAPGSPTPAPGPTPPPAAGSPTPAPAPGAINTDSSPGSANLAILAVACAVAASLHVLTASA